MAWHTIEPLSRENRADPRVKVSLVKAKSRSASLLLAVRLSPPSLVALTIKKGDRVQVDRGSGEDDGWLRLVKNPQGFTIRDSSTGGSLFFAFVAWPECGQKPLRGDFVEWEPDGRNTIKVKLPSWAVADTRFTEEPITRRPFVQSVTPGGNGVGKPHPSILARS